MTHDYSWSVIKGLTGEILGNEKRVTIGSNVFIGWGATILCGTRIPDNTIIGAHAVVSGILDGNSVWGGVPAKRICSLEDFRAKRAAAQLSEAKDFVLAYRERYGENPPAEIVDEYFMLFAADDELNEKYLYQMSLMGTYGKTRDLLPETRQFDSYVDFLASF